jgi:DNA-binding MarR family transcriptional regulator
MRFEWQERAADYLRETLGIEVVWTPFAGVGRLPLQITETYEISGSELLGKALLALKAREAAPRAAVLAKQADWLHEKTGLRSLFVLGAISAYERKRLIEARVPFLSTARQLYVPDLGLDLSERLKPRPAKLTNLSSPAQVVVLASVLHRIEPHGEFTGAGLAERFGYTKMTMSRALDELRRAELMVCAGARRYARHRFLVTGRELWERARPWLRSPVARRVYLQERVPYLEFRAGESALAAKTMLGTPPRAIWAVPRTQWRMLQQAPGTSRVSEVPAETAPIECELWCYDPHLLADLPDVDPLSLVLSLNEATDERVQMAVTKLLEDVAW